MPDFISALEFLGRPTDNEEDGDLEEVESWNSEQDNESD